MRRDRHSTGIPAFVVFAECLIVGIYVRVEVFAATDGWSGYTLALRLLEMCREEYSELNCAFEVPEGHLCLTHAGCPA